MSFTWTREMVKDLIVAYEAQPVLYVSRLPEYKNKSKRVDAINKIRTQLQEKYPAGCRNLESSMVVQKIHVLRTQFLKEKGTLKKFLTSGAAEDVYQPKLWCFEMLQFVSEGDPVRQGESNLHVLQDQPFNSQGHDGEEEEMVFEGTIEELHSANLLSPSSSRASTASPLPCSSTPIDAEKKRKRLTKTPNDVQVSNILSSAVTSLAELRKKKKEEENNEFDLFGRTVAMELRKVKDPAKLRDVKKIIINAVLDAQE